MESLINFAYSGKVVISTNNVQNLMLGASFLQLNRVRDACAEFLQLRLSPGNVLGIRHFAESVGRQAAIINTNCFCFFSTRPLNFLPGFLQMNEKEGFSERRTNSSNFCVTRPATKLVLLS